MKKYAIDFRVAELARLSESYALLKLVPADGSPLPPMLPGQFVQVEVPNSKTTYLRRPISVNFADYEKNQLWLLVRKAGEGTSALISLEENAVVNVILPLGNGFSMEPCADNKAVLLVGGGVGVAPLLYAGAELKRQGIPVIFLLGARSAKDVLELDDFKAIGEVCVSTEDGSLGEKGLVTAHSVLGSGRFGRVSCCGPKPMMVAVAREAKRLNVPCEVSLENVMACGLGACLCCVEDTNDHGNVCVCKDGPVFNIEPLKWQI